MLYQCNILWNLHICAPSAVVSGLTSGPGNPGGPLSPGWPSGPCKQMGGHSPSVIHKTSLCFCAWSYNLRFLFMGVPFRRSTQNTLVSHLRSRLPFLSMLSSQALRSRKTLWTRTTCSSSDSCRPLTHKNITRCLESWVQNHYLQGSSQLRCSFRVGAIYGG